MKTYAYYKYFALSTWILIAISVFGQTEEVDDVYFSTKDRAYERSGKYKLADQPSNKTEENRSSQNNGNQDVPSSFQRGQDLADANTNNNYDNYNEEDDYYSGEYSSRINRFHREPSTNNYYDPRFADPFVRHRWNVRTSFAFGYDPFFYDPWFSPGFSVSFGYGNPWYWNDPFYYGYNFGHPYYRPYRYCGNNWWWNRHAYNQGYWDGFHDGVWLNRPYYSVEHYRPRYYGRRYNNLRTANTRPTPAGSGNSRSSRATQYKPVQSSKNVNSYTPARRKSSYGTTRPSSSGTGATKSTRINRYNNSNTTRPNSTRPNSGTTRPSQNNTRPNTNTTRPNSNSSRPKYNSTRPRTGRDNNYSKPRRDSNSSTRPKSGTQRRDNSYNRSSRPRSSSSRDNSSGSSSFSTGSSGRSSGSYRNSSSGRSNSSGRSSGSRRPR